MAFLFFFPLGIPVLYPAQLALEWDPVPEPDLAGYKIYYGNVSRNYSAWIDVGKNNSGVIPLPEGRQVLFLAVTSYDSLGNESQFSEEISYPQGDRCDLALSLLNPSFPAAGGSGAVTVQAQAGCRWVTASRVSWLTLTSGQSGEGTGKIQFSLSPNYSPGARTGELTVAGSTLSILQEGMSQPEPYLLAIKAGGSEYTSSTGTRFHADSYFRGGAVYATGQTVQRTTDGPLYKTGRVGTFSYSIPLPQGTYEVTLKFVESYWSARGRRIFDVFIEGSRALERLDLFAVAGKNNAYDLSILVKVTDGTLDLDFLPLTGQATVNAILIRSAPDSINPSAQPLMLKKYYSSETKSPSP